MTTCLECQQLEDQLKIQLAYKRRLIKHVEDLSRCITIRNERLSIQSPK